MNTEIKPVTFILKIQRPITGNEPRKLWLVYNKSRVFMRQIPEVHVPAQVVKDMGEDMKGYFNAYLKQAELHICDRVFEAQDW